MHIRDVINVKQNLYITARERGKIVARREGHNIFVDLGREWLTELICYANYGTLATVRDDRVKYMGVGIGGIRQIASSIADNLPITPPYGGSNVQTDTDVTVTTLERPVRVSGSTSAYPGVSGDEWVGLIGSADYSSVPNEVTFTRIFTQVEVSYGTFLSVPLSEIGLFTAAADPENYQNTLIAYDIFDTISKTSALDLEVRWVLRF